MPSPSETPRRPDGDTGDDRSFVRPYLMTGGRTRPAVDHVRLETLIRRVEDPSDATLDPREDRILSLCAAPISVIDLANAAALPIGVVRVLVNDLAGDGLLAPIDTGVDQITIVRSLLDGIRDD